MENNSTYNTRMLIKHYEEECNTKGMIFLIENPDKTITNFIENKIEELKQQELEYKRKCNLSDDEVYQEIIQTTKVANYIAKGLDKTQKEDFDRSLENDFLEFRKKYTLKENNEDSLQLKFYKTKLESLPNITSTIEETEREEKTPYKIALFKKLGFFELDNVKNKSKENQYKIIQKLIGGDLRTIKGNVLVLNAKSSEDRMKYTSNEHLQNATDYLDKLK